jgi:hypothetical protein
VGHAVRCPACEADNVGSLHLFYLKMSNGSPGWTFNGDVHKPTFTPSMLARVRLAGVEHVCHNFVTDGRIQYLGDCTHALKGQTIDLPPFDEEDS